MPWSIEQRDGKFCVIRENDGFNQGCHDERADAIKQQRALYAKEDTMTASINLRPEVVLKSSGNELVVRDDQGNEVAREPLEKYLEQESMTAAAAPLKPPRAWFERPEADKPTPPTFTAAGEAYGHLALWETCHSGFQGGAFSECVTAPRSPSGYQMFHLGQLETDDGMVAVGKLTYGTGHAPIGVGLQAASSHYDDTGSVGAFVRVVDGRYGPWFSGAIKSDLTPEGLRDLRANPLSGDWRSLNNQLELVAALAVVVPGFPIPRSQLALAASGQISALILPPVQPEDLPEPHSKEFLRRREALAASIRNE